MGGGLRIVTARSSAEFELCAGVTNAVSPEMAVSAGEIEHTMTEQQQARLFLARLGDVPVGTAFVTPSSVLERAYAMVRVLPEHRRRGLGSALLYALSEHARDLGLEAVWGRVRDDDPASMTAVLRWGFEESGREPRVAVDVRRAPEPGKPPAGVEIISLADRPDLARAAWEVECEAITDVPAPLALAAQSFEKWLATNIESPSSLPAGSFVALVGDEVVGHSGLEAREAQPGSAANLFTGVRRAWRGRGVATALKQAQIAWARDMGFAEIVTTNDEPNAAMRGVNARVGYEPAGGAIFVAGPIRDRG